jgi:hypothetical protein
MADSSSSSSAAPLKGIALHGEGALKVDGNTLIGIVHSTWNREVIDALVSGAVEELKRQGMKEENIIIQSVRGTPARRRRRVRGPCF